MTPAECHDTLLRVTGNGDVVTVAETCMKCVECGRVFHLADPDDADEWAYGHDCEPVNDWHNAPRFD